MQSTGELHPWHPVTLSINGPAARETDTFPNPFTDLRFDVAFQHPDRQRPVLVPGYFAADGKAAETSATGGNVWRAHFVPDTVGVWTYELHFRQRDRGGRWTAVDSLHGQTGRLVVTAGLASDAGPRDFRRRGRLAYVGKHHYRFLGDGSYFLKFGADAPETLLAYNDFDDTYTLRPDMGKMKDYTPHVRDWREGDPTWKNGLGKGLIGGLNYLAGVGVNGISFIPYNVGGDGRNVWPMVDPEDKLHYDCSKLDQWNVVFAHAQAQGLHLHFKLQETENDDHRLREDGTEDYFSDTHVPAALDGGETGPERRLYLRELIARFGHHLALSWNLGEENSQSTEQQRAMSDYIRHTDPYGHPITMQTYPNEQAYNYDPLLGEATIDGPAIQDKWDAGHRQTLHWVEASAAAGRPWVVCHDEQNSWKYGVPPDLGYQGYAGVGREGETVGYDEHDVRQRTLWGNLLAGGGGVEYYFGWMLPEPDLWVEDFRSRERSWAYGRYALAFFTDNQLPFWEMHNADALVGNAARENGRFCLAGREATAPVVVYLPAGSVTGSHVDLSDRPGVWELFWYNPRMGGELQRGSLLELSGGAVRELGFPPTDADQDWVGLLRRK